MSHFSTIKTELRNLNTVKAALRRLNLAFEEGGTVEDYYHATHKVDLRVAIPGQRAVGFVSNPRTGLVDLVGDWFGGATSQQSFLDSLKGNYAREQVLESLERQGVDLSKLKETEEPDGTVIFELPLEQEEMGALTENA
jgi:hypothetical protein